MSWHDHIVDARRLWPGDAGDFGPLALIDLDGAVELPEHIELPPCPVIGFGDPAHPLAAALDAVVEPPVSLTALINQIVAHPRAAAVAVDLLRILPDLNDQSGLVAESLAQRHLLADHARAHAQRGTRRLDDDIDQCPVDADEG